LEFLGVYIPYPVGKSVTDVLGALQDGKTFNVWRAYGQSKACNALFSVALTEKAKSKGVLAFTVDPGCKCSLNIGLLRWSAN
jgi:NAD(P)-dependent dehydrogenase (short-subunit alcohol dehydrogenase family)